MRSAFNKRDGLEFRPTYTIHNKLTVNQENTPSKKTDFGVGARGLITIQLHCETGNLLSFLSYIYQGSRLLEVNWSEQSGSCSLLQSSVEVKKAWSFTFTLLYVFLT